MARSYVVWGSDCSAGRWPRLVAFVGTGHAREWRHADV